MDKQKIYNQVRDHLLAQGKKAMRNAEFDGDSPSCAYRGADGTKCAIGALIPDDLYKPTWDTFFGTRAGSLISDSDELRKHLGIGDDLLGDIIPAGHFLDQLQAIHDRKDPATWRDRLTEFAQAHGLQP